MDKASQMDAYVVIDRLVAGGIDGFLLPPPLWDDPDLLDLIRRQCMHRAIRPRRRMSRRIIR